MKAIVVSEFGKPEVLKYVDHPKPEPTDEQLLIEVKAIGVNPVDTYKRSGYGTYATSKLPYIPGGSDAAGIISQVGKSLQSRFKVGERVFTTGSITGTYAQYMLSTPNDVFPLPETLTFEQGAGIWVPYGTAYRAMNLKGQVSKGQIVLVHGASGGVGTACVQIGQQVGAFVIGTASTEEGRTLVKNLGAQVIFDHKNNPDYVSEILSHETVKANGGVDLIIEMLANVNLEKDLQMIKKGGRIIIVGNRGRIEITPRDIMFKESWVTGVMLMETTEEEKKQTVKWLEDGLSKGQLKPTAGKLFKLENSDQAHVEVIEGNANGKVIITV